MTENLHRAVNAMTSITAHVQQARGAWGGGEPLERTWRALHAKRGGRHIFVDPGKRSR
jgi:hypothetical protein